MDLILNFGFFISFYFYDFGIENCTQNRKLLNDFKACRSTHLHIIISNTPVFGVNSMGLENFRRETITKQHKYSAARLRRLSGETVSTVETINTHR